MQPRVLTCRKTDQLRADPSMKNEILTFCRRMLANSAGRACFKPLHASLPSCAFTPLLSRPATGGTRLRCTRGWAGLSGSHPPRERHITGRRVIRSANRRPIVALCGPRPPGTRARIRRRLRAAELKCDALSAGGALIARMYELPLVNGSDMSSVARCMHYFEPSATCNGSAAFTS